MSDKEPRPILWADLHEIYLMQMRGGRLYSAPTVKEHDARVRSEMTHEMHSIIYDIENGRQS